MNINVKKYILLAIKEIYTFVFFTRLYISLTMFLSHYRAKFLHMSGVYTRASATMPQINTQEVKTSSMPKRDKRIES